MGNGMGQVAAGSGVGRGGARRRGAGGCRRGRGWARMKQVYDSAGGTQIRPEVALAGARGRSSVPKLVRGSPQLFLGQH